MTVSAAMLVLDPPLDRMALLVEYLRPLVRETIVVVDDRTAAETVDTIAQWDGVRVVPFRWCDDFATARNAALPHCTGDWILHVDPDELPSRAMMDFIAAVDASEIRDIDWFGIPHPYPRGYLFWTRNFYDGQLSSEDWQEQDWHCRLFRRTEGRWYKPIHEQVALMGKPEPMLRETAFMPKAPRSAVLIHSRKADSAEKREQYAMIEARV